MINHTGREPTIFPPMDKTTLIKQFIFNAGASIVSVQFVKTNGEQRSLQFNPRDTQEIKGTGHALKATSIVRCRDFAIARKEGKALGAPLIASAWSASKPTVNN